ncbi:MAG: Tripartite-type tricarboxylate transporter, receptor component TctC [Rubritepida sp.]|nr:Tripartite-type tricarboxylate transporter, receptor component TctC [Rubritepida sp.]
MILRRRHFFAAPLLGTAAYAQTPQWPTRPVRLIVPYAAGGPSDIIARAVQSRLSAALGQPVVVENRGGGGAMIGTEAVARADDGHTFLVADSPHTIIPAVQPRVPYDPVGDFAPVGLLGAVAMILMVNARHPATDLASFLAMARAQPETTTFGSSGIGSLTHLLPEWLAQLAGVRFTVVPYRGSGPALLDVAAGQIAAIFSSTLSAAGPLSDGSVRPIAVASASRLPALPDMPTFRESGLEMVSGNWWGVLAPRRTPPPAIERLSAGLTVALADPNTRERMAALGIEPRPQGPVPFGELLATEFRTWAQVARAAGVSAQ